MRPTQVLFQTRNQILISLLSYIVIYLSNLTMAKVFITKIAKLIQDIYGIVILIPTDTLQS
jgi:hypothetical protein